MTIYRTGYGLWKNRDDFVQAVHDLDAVVVDVRYSPHSKDPLWSGASLAGALGEGHYEHVAAWGNRNYQGGPVDLVDPVVGIRAVEKALERKPNVILLCACWNQWTCHRHEVGRCLEAAGFQTEEMDVKAFRPKKGPDWTQMMMF